MCVSLCACVCVCVCVFVCVFFRLYKIHIKSNKLYCKQSAHKRKCRKAELIITFKLNIKENVETYYVIRRLLDLNLIHKYYTER